jgi:hypothetical protein
VARGWRGLYNEELRNLYASPNIVRVTKSGRMRWMGHETHTGEMRNVCILVGKPEWKRSVTRPKCR